MTLISSAVQAQAATASGFTAGEALAVFVVVMVVLAVLLAFVGRRTRRLVSRPRLRSAHSRRIRRAAEQDFETIEQDEAPWREVPGHRDDRRNDEL
jgi:membrane protein implicated in regulation of membrane protease activity